jgi:hypothetical protein
MGQGWTRLYAERGRLRRRLLETVRVEPITNSVNASIPATRDDAIVHWADILRLRGMVGD